MINEIDHINELEEAAHQLEKAEFMLDVQMGLLKARKQIHSKYFYDADGSELFNEITRHPDYYLTNCEIEILHTYKNEITNLFINKPFNLIELGPGEGAKTEILLDEFLKHTLDFSYIPIDISKKYLEALMKGFSKKLTPQQLMPIYADYFRGLEQLREQSKRPNLVLFLGSSIGNFSPIQTQEFLTHLHHSLNKNDYVLVGFDLRKDADVLMRAYSDSDGITRDFNMNLLHRINRELGADFDVNKFQHYATYNVYTGAMESYLLSLENQIVKIRDLEQAFSFEAIEPIHVEYSHKFSLTQINEYAKKTGFEIIHHYTDKRKYFIDALWRVR